MIGGRRQISPWTIPVGNVSLNSNKRISTAAMRVEPNKRSFVQTEMKLLRDAENTQKCGIQHTLWNSKESRMTQS